jgi:outer membrane protein assembly factor BamB
MSKTLSFLLVCICGLLAGCSHPAVYESLPVQMLPAGSFALSWIYPLDLSDDSVTTIDVRDQWVYVITADKKVTALDRKSGKFKFAATVNTPSPHLHPPVELTDKIVFPTVISLEIFDKKGNHLSSMPLRSTLRSGAAGSSRASDITNDTIYFGADDPAGGRVIAKYVAHDFDINRWELLTPGGAIASTPVFFDDVLYVATEAGQVYAVNENRAPVWNIDTHIFQAAGPIIADLKVDKDGLYIASKDSHLYCVNPVNTLDADSKTNHVGGTLKWEFFPGAPLSATPAPTADMVYQYIPDQGMAAIDKLKGPFIRPARWIYPGATQFLAEDDHYAYLLVPRTDLDDKNKTDNFIIAVDKQTGEKAFESRHSDYSVFGTNLNDNLIYAGYATGQILAIEPVITAGRVGELVLVPRVDLTAGLH